LNELWSLYIVNVYFKVPGTRIKPMATTTGNVEVKTDRSCRLLALRSMLEKLPKVNFQVLKFVFQHFVK
jgi:capsule polysaccharide export protein KpsC/LpsZ